MAKETKETVAQYVPGQVANVPLSMIRTTEGFNMRDLDQDTVKMLAASMKQYGQLQPIIGYYDEASMMVDVVAGHHRVGAIRELSANDVKLKPGWSSAHNQNTVSVKFVAHKPYASGDTAEPEDRITALEINLTENLARKTASATEIGRTLQKLSALGKTDQYLAGRFGMSKAAVTQMRKISDLSLPLQDFIHYEAIPVSITWQMPKIEDRPVKPLHELTDAEQKDLASWISSKVDADARNKPKDGKSLSAKDVAVRVVEMQAAVAKPIVKVFAFKAAKVPSGTKSKLRWELVGATSADIGGAPIDNALLAKGEIEVTIPAGITEWKLTAKNDNGESVSVLHSTGTVEETATTPTDGVTATATKSPQAASSVAKAETESEEFIEPETVQPRREHAKDNGITPHGGKRATDGTLLQVAEWIAHLATKGLADGKPVHVSNPVSRCLTIMERFLNGSKDANQTALELSAMAAEMAEKGYIAPALPKAATRKAS